MNLVTKQAMFHSQAPNLKQLTNKMSRIAGFNVRTQLLDPTSSRWLWRARIFFLDDPSQTLMMGYQVGKTHAIPHTEIHTIYFEASDSCEPMLILAAALALQELGGILEPPISKHTQMTLKRNWQKQPYALRLLRASGITPIVWVSALVILPFTFPTWLLTKVWRSLDQLLKNNSLLFRY